MSGNYGNYSEAFRVIHEALLKLSSSPKLLNVPAPVISTAAYASATAGPLVISVPYKRITVNIKENNTNAIMYKIIGYTESSGFTRPITLLTDVDVSKNGSSDQIVEMPLLAVDVQIVDKVGGTHGSATVDVVLG